MTTAIAPQTLPNLLVPTLSRYFEAFNKGDFETVAQLFAPAGQLRPPFEEPVQGPAAIAHYLQQEAAGFRCQPQSAQYCGEAIQVRGQVHAPCFSLNVVWQFALHPNQTLASVQIELQASLEDLFHLTR